MINSLLFVLGILLAIRAIAACYGVIDLWYCWRSHWYKVLARISLWLLLICTAVVFSGPEYRAALIYGLLFFSIFHFLIYWVGQLLRIKLEKHNSQ